MEKALSIVTIGFLCMWIPLLIIGSWFHFVESWGIVWFGVLPAMLLLGGCAVVSLEEEQ